MLGTYRIDAEIGRGGMGRVYRAHDAALNRDVAIKVLPDALATDPDRLMRFEREAQALAALNHPNIAHIYGLERSGPTPAIVMELVDGPTLADRIAQGPIPVDEALPIARQIAEGLEAAHERGILHRDLKPANIKVREDGTVKLLDFGLAKALAPDLATAVHGLDAANSPTITTPAMTQAGVILGTAAYMSPEQARGRPVDRRTDVWAFGAVFYEMVTGRPCFDGHTVTDVLAAVVKTEPDWSLLPSEVPHTVRRLLRRCLTKDAKERLHDMGDARLDLADVFDDTGLSRPAGAAPPLVSRERLAWSLTVAVLLLGLVGLYIAYSPSPSLDLIRTVVRISPADQLRSSAPARYESLGAGRPSSTALALSPDGRRLVFSAVRDGQQQLFARPLDRLDAEPIPNTEDADSPFFSPDGEWIGFWSKGALRKVSANGGAATPICETGNVVGASWGSTGRIVFARLTDGLWVVPESGGMPERLTTVDKASNEYTHRLPHFLPDGKTVVFTVVYHGFLGNWDEARLSVVSTDGGSRFDLGPGADARFAETRTGHLVFVRSGRLVAVPFDPSRPKPFGNPITLIPDLMQAANMPDATIDTGAGQYSFSASGALAYVPGGVYPDRENHVWSLDRSGHGEVLPLPAGAWMAVDLSPDETKLLIWKQGLDRGIWTYDRQRRVTSRVNLDGRNHRAIWTPDGTRIVFTSRSGALMWAPADGSGRAEPVAEGVMGVAGSWSPDGETLAFAANSLGLPPDDTGRDIMVVTPRKGATPTPVIQTPGSDNGPDFSPDGQQLAYYTGGQVWVQAYPNGSRVQVSTNGGISPGWSADGSELFYFEESVGQKERLMVVPIRSMSPFIPGSPRVLFEREFGILQTVTRGWDVTRDGQRFFVVEQEDRPPTPVTEITLVQNWFAELERLVPRR